MFNDLFVTLKSWVARTLEKLQETRAVKESHEAKEENH